MKWRFSKVIVLLLAVNASYAQNSPWLFFRSPKASIKGAWQDLTYPTPRYFIINDDNGVLTGHYLGDLPVRTINVARISGYIDGTKYLYEHTHNINIESPNASVINSVNSKYNVTLDSDTMKGSREFTIRSFVRVYSEHNKDVDTRTEIFTARKLSVLPIEAKNDLLFIQYMKLNSMYDDYK